MSDSGNISVIWILPVVKSAQKVIILSMLEIKTAWKVANCGVFSRLHFPIFGLNTKINSEISVFSPNAGKNVQEKLCIWSKIQ